MPKRIVKAPVIVHRDGKQFQPPIGKEFEFTDQEVKEINELSPSSIDVIAVEDKPAAKADLKV